MSYTLLQWQWYLCILFILLSGVLPEISSLKTGIKEHNAENISTTESTAIKTEDGTLISPTGNSLECISTLDSDFHFTFKSYRNNSGHWIAEMNIQHGEGIVTTEEEPFEVQLEHHTVSCALCDDPGPVYARLAIHEAPPIRTPKASGYRYFPGFGFYKRHMELLTWREARATCEKEGADLVVINSEEEAKLILEMSAPMLFLQPGNTWNAEAYVGIYDFHHEGHFTTVTGQPLDESGYVHWNKGEPNNFREEDCVTIVRNAMYNDVHCNTLFEFICEIPEKSGQFKSEDGEFAFIRHRNLNNTRRYVYEPTTER